MNTTLKDAALIISKSVLPLIPQDELAKTPSRLYALACDFLCEPKFNDAKKLIRKGCDSGAYTLVLNANANRDIEAKKAVAQLVDSELMAQEHAREIIGMLLIALDSDAKNVSAVESWVDECAKPSTDSTLTPASVNAPTPNVQGAGSYDVYLMSDKDRKLECIKAIRQRYGWGLVQAKDFVEGPTRPIAANVSGDDADALRQFFASHRIQTAIVSAGAKYDPKTYVPQKQQSTTTSSGSDTIESLIKRMFVFLKDKNWTSASKHAEMVLAKDPACAQAYLGKLMAEYKLTDEKHLGLASTPRFSSNANFKHACDFASVEQRKIFKQYETENAYAHGVDAMRRASSEKAYKDASSWFAFDLSYKDSRKLYDECLQKAEIERKEVLYQKALHLPLEQQPAAFEALSGYRDADNLRSNALYELNRQQKEKSRAVRYGKGLSFWGAIVILFVIGVDIVFVRKYQPIGSNYAYAILTLLPLLITVVTLPLVIRISEHPYASNRIKPFWNVSCILWGIIRGVWGAIVYFNQSGLTIWPALPDCVLIFAMYSICYFISAIIGKASFKGQRTAIRLSLLGIVVILIAIVADIYLAISLKDNSVLCRWLWLPLISWGISVIVSTIIKKIGDCLYVSRRYYRFWSIPATIWGIGRGILVLVEQYQSSNGVDSFGTVLLFLVMFLLNSVAYFSARKMSSR